MRGRACTTIGGRVDTCPWRWRETPLPLKGQVGPCHWRWREAPCHCRGRCNRTGTELKTTPIDINRKCIEIKINQKDNTRIASCHRRLGKAPCHWREGGGPLHFEMERGPLPLEGRGGPLPLEV